MLVVLLGLAFPALLYAHLALRSSSPEEGESLDQVPTEIRLGFTEAVELPLSRIVLIGPSGEVALSGLQADEVRTELWALIEGGMEPGDYVVQWQAVGLDGHPVPGEFGFTVETGAIGIPSIQPSVPIQPPPAATPASTPAAAASFDAQSPLFAAVRWLNYLGIVAITGGAAFMLLLFQLARLPESGVPASLRDGASRGAVYLGLFAVLLLALSLTLWLQSQSHALFGRDVDAEAFSLLISSRWGTAWGAQAIAGGIVLIGLGIGLRRIRPGIAIVVSGAILLSLSAGLSGHSAAVDSTPLLAILADGLHVLAVGSWLGALFVFVVIGVPHLKKLSETDRPRAYASILHGFSSMALVSGALIFATGLFAATLHLDGPADLWRSAYGRLLLAKLLLVFTIFAGGAYNWRRLPRDRHRPGAESMLRRNGAVELTAALLVIALTSILVAVPPPSTSEGPQTDAVTSTLAD